MLQKIRNQRVPADLFMKTVEGTSKETNEIITETAEQNRQHKGVRLRRTQQYFERELDGSDPQELEVLKSILSLLATFVVLTVSH